MSLRRPNQNAAKILSVFFVFTVMIGVAFYFFAEEAKGPSALYGNLKGYFATHRVDRSQPVALASFATLHEDVGQGGIQQFQRKKEELKSEVKSNLTKDLESPERDRAENIAVYMFPELLDKNDFERDVAMDSWYPQEQKIEQNPHSPESRKEFEEMKNNVWNYENPDREVPIVSDYAAQVIRIYDALSRSE